MCGLLVINIVIVLVFCVGLLLEFKLYFVIFVVMIKIFLFGCKVM